MRHDAGRLSIGAALGAVAFLIADAVEAKYWGCLSVYAGAFVAMAVLLFVRGPGNLFPIALVIGGGVLFICAAAGTAGSLLVSK